MKTDIHPKYSENVEIHCSCGNVMVVGSTKDKMKTELCSKCHPFYTGQQKLVDTAGRVDKFQEKRKKFEALTEEKAKRAEAKKKKPEGYKEREIPAEVLARAMGTAAEEAKPEGKWGGPLGESASEQEVKDEIQVQAEETRAPKAKKVAKGKKAKTAE